MKGKIQRTAVGYLADKSWGEAIDGWVVTTALNDKRRAFHLHLDANGWTTFRVAIDNKCSECKAETPKIVRFMAVAGGLDD